MSITIDEQIDLLLHGKSLETSDIVGSKVCENNGADSKETNSTLGNHAPHSPKTVTYIVAAVILSDNGEVLMIQEAKPSCKGKWYLPAGRVEPRETLVEAVKREVLEETGLIFEPSTLILTEAASGSWFRFVFTGEIVGGSLKTLKEANEESLQATWVKNIGELDLRSHDVISVIEKGKAYIQNERGLKHPDLLPVSTPLPKLWLQLVISCKERATNMLHVLVTKATPSRLPKCEIDPDRSLLSTLHNFMVEIFGTGVAQHKPHGLLSVEFSDGHAGNGLCMTLLISFKLPLEDVFPIEKYSWQRISTTVAAGIISRLPKNMTVPLNVVR